MCFVNYKLPGAFAGEKILQDYTNSNCRREYCHFVLLFTVQGATMLTRVLHDFPARRTLQSKEAWTTFALIKVRKCPLLLWGQLSQVPLYGMIVHYNHTH